MAVKTSSANVPSKSRLTEYIDTQQRLPYWARSTNPIVRRHLGLYWRTIPPEIRPFTIIFLSWASVMGIGIVFPPLLSLTMISFLAAIMVIPIAMGLYAHVLITVAIDSARAMQQEFSNSTFQLLQATPMTIDQILLGKVAAAIWKRMDDIVLIGLIAMIFTPPISYTIYADFFAPSDYGAVVPSVLTLLATLVTVIRIFLEPLMIGVLAVFIGTVVPGKGRAISSAVVIGVFYFLLINLMSRLPMVRGLDSRLDPLPPNETLIIMMDLVLPILLPIIIIVGLLKLGNYILTSD